MNRPVRRDDATHPRELPEENTTAQIAQWSRSDSVVTLYRTDGEFPWVIVWEHDGDVVEEEYNVASVAFARMAVLVHAIQTDVALIQYPASRPDDRVRFGVQVRRMLSHTTSVEGPLTTT